MLFTAMGRQLKWGARQMNCPTSYSSRRQISIVSKGFMARLQRELDEFAEDQRIRTAAPDWLPFRPGSSFWMPEVPPHQPYLLQTQTLQERVDDDDEEEEEEQEEEEEEIARASEDKEDGKVVCHLVLLDTSSPSDSESES
ncbi:hypothetical protein SUGI_0633750 [Cryptomeria japonica]|uniref:uncharacterized protein LOC131051066 n=1 Tax=Cryptomeria japonica TaxID=3369 RepID=UPI0024148313|nr:uncharacterized protein LOC131051066 [Cryptomeria japonica]GLJ31579.1 hypothetical protein SUGI_0633750 [Cryptomeria japonica]